MVLGQEPQRHDAGAVKPQPLAQGERVPGVTGALVELEAQVGHRGQLEAERGRRAQRAERLRAAAGLEQAGRAGLVEQFDGGQLVQRTEPPYAEPGLVGDGEPALERRPGPWQVARAARCGRSARMPGSVPPPWHRRPRGRPRPARRHPRRRRPRTSFRPRGPRRGHGRPGRSPHRGAPGRGRHARPPPATGWRRPRPGRGEGGRRRAVPSHRGRSVRRSRPRRRPPLRPPGRPGRAPPPTGHARRRGPVPP